MILSCMPVKTWHIFCNTYIDDLSTCPTICKAIKLFWAQIKFQSTNIIPKTYRRGLLPTQLFHLYCTEMGHVPGRNLFLSFADFRVWCGRRGEGAKPMSRKWCKVFSKTGNDIPSWSGERTQSSPGVQEDDPSLPPPLSHLKKKRRWNKK